MIRQCRRHPYIFIQLLYIIHRRVQSYYLHRFFLIPDTILCSAAALQDIQDILQAALKLYDILWGKDINVILLDVPNGSGLKYVPKSWVHDLELHSLKYGETALLVREEYIVAFENLEAQSKVEDSRGVVVFGQPGIDA